MITNHLNVLMTGSAPGAMFHNLHVVAAPVDAVGPFGRPDEQALKGCVYAIDSTGPGGSAGVERRILDVIVAAGLEHTGRRESVLFAALAKEGWASPNDARARELRRAGRLAEHPEMYEVTWVYAVCRDGRRWRGRHYLTGPRAGELVGPDILVGQPARDEAGPVGESATAALLTITGLRPRRPGG